MNLNSNQTFLTGPISNGMKKVVVSAPAKIHLSGEHAVVHGKPAVVVSTSKRLFVTLETLHTKEITFETAEDQKYLKHILSTFEKKYSLQIHNIKISISSDIPIGAGMGSSAALAVATIGAFTAYYGKQWNVKEINELAYQTEKFQHGNSSGSDPTTSANGGILWYRKELDYLKTFWLLSFKIPQSFKPFVLINTGRTETAGELIVGVVGELKNKNEKEFEWLIARIEKVTRALVAAIHDENEVEMRKQIQANELLLEEMGVVSKQTKKLIRDIEKAGGVAKISGAGGVKTGSGIVVATHDKPQMLVTIAKKHNFSSFQVRLGGEGVKLEQAIA